MHQEEGRPGKAEYMGTEHSKVLVWTPALNSTS